MSLLVIISLLLATSLILQAFNYCFAAFSYHEVNFTLQLVWLILATFEPILILGSVLVILTSVMQGPAFSYILLFLALS